MGKLVPVKGMRKIIAGRMVESHLVSPDATHFVQVDMTAEKAFREKLQEKYGRKFSANVVFAKAAARALSEFPYVNASYHSGKDGEGDTIELHDHVNVGFAVGVSGGVVVVNVADCNEKAYPEVAAELDRLFSASRTNTLKMEDITGSTFSIASMAIVEDEIFHIPIINQPNLSIMGVYRPKDTPVVVEGEIVIRPIMYLTIVTDHRVIDGVMTGEFIARIKRYIQHPEELEN